MVTGTAARVGPVRPEPAPSRPGRRTRSATARLLRRKLRRDLARRRWQFTAVGATIVLGVMLFAASYDAFLNLTASYQRTYDDLAFADLTISGGDQGAAGALAGTTGVAAVVQRTQADVPIAVDADHRLVGRMVGLPASGQPAVGRVDVMEGSYLDPAVPDGVLVERHMADHFGLEPGDTLDVLLESGPTRVEVLGSVASAEYLFPAKSRQELFSLPDDFGVLFVPEELADQAPQAARVPQTLVRYEDGADRQALDAGLTQAAVDAGADDVTTQEEQPSNAALAEDLQGFSELAVLFPALFLTGAGLATFVMLNRIVYAQRAQIGTLTANGLSRRQVLRHYLSYGLILGVAGSAVGLLAGMALGAWMTGAYTDALSIPDTVTELSIVTPVVGLAFGIVMGALSALAPARAAVRVAPAEAMRGPAPTNGVTRASLLERLVPPLRRLPVRWRMSLRGIGRNRRRSAATVTGVVLAIILILASWGMIDTVQILLARQFDEVQREDAQAFLTEPADDAALARVAGVDGVAEAETVVTLETTLRADGRQYASQLQGFDADTVMHRFLTSGGRDIALPESGVLAGASVRDLLDVEAGDRLTMSFPALGATINVELAGFVDEPLGTYVYMARGPLTDALAAGPDAVAPDELLSPAVSSAFVVYEAGADGDAVQAALEAEDVVFTVVSSTAFRDLVDDFLALFYAFVGIMLVFGGIMAFALVFNTISVNISERATELATMRASGLSSRRVNHLMTVENLILTLIGIPIGLLVGYWVSAAFMRGFSSDLFRFDLQVHPRTYVFIALAILAVTLLSQWPGLRAVRRLDIAEVVRERAQ
jgi:putative ABC transport system permease protein